MTQLAGILNLTPDSFSGDGVHLSVAEALARVDAMIGDGASIIDIGAESTRPGAQILSPAEEWQRLAQVAGALGERIDKARFSIDTRHAEVARCAVEAGFLWVNDVSGGRDPEMLALARETGCMLVLMHSLSIPADPSRTLAPDTDATDEVMLWCNDTLARAEKVGVSRTQIILDPGIGFGKTPLQSLALIRNVARFKTLNAPLLVGHSRKSFLSLFTDKPSSLRDPETLAVSSWLVDQKVDYLRVHDVKSHAAMLRFKAAL